MLRDKALQAAFRRAGQNVKLDSIAYTKAKQKSDLNLSVEQQLANAIDTLVGSAWVRKRHGRELAYRREILLAQESTPTDTLARLIEIVQAYASALDSRQQRALKILNEALKD